MKIQQTEEGWLISHTNFRDNDILIPILAKLEQEHCAPTEEPTSASLALARRINFTPEENAAVLACFQSIQAEREAQKNSLVVACSYDKGELVSQILSSRYREVLLKIRLAHGCPEDKFNMHGSVDGYWFELIPAPNPEGQHVFMRNNPALS